MSQSEQTGDSRVLDAAVDIEIVRYDRGEFASRDQSVATEVPFTIFGNEIEVATVLCTPCDLRELCCGFLYTSGLLRSVAEIRSCHIDTTRWTGRVEMDRDPDPSIFTQRLFTSGCGKGVTYANLSELSFRHPLRRALSIEPERITAIAGWLQRCSENYRATGGVHTAALSFGASLPDGHFDDIGRHNAVDKAIGDALFRNLDFSGATLVTSGRVSSEILHKARSCGIAVLVARGAPTHQAVLRARDMAVTLVGRARGKQFTVYSEPERIHGGS